MDDLLTGGDSITDAVVKLKNIIEIARSYGFNLRKLKTNEILLARAFDKTITETPQEEKPFMESTTSMLGITWIPSGDSLQVRLGGL
jgi:hypothetical protein